MIGLDDTTSIYMDDTIYALFHDLGVAHLGRDEQQKLCVK